MFISLSILRFAAKGALVDTTNLLMVRALAAAICPPTAPAPSLANSSAFSFQSITNFCSAVMALFSFFVLTSARQPGRQRLISSHLIHSAALHANASLRADEDLLAMAKPSNTMDKRANARGSQSTLLQHHVWTNVATETAQATRNSRALVVLCVCAVHSQRTTHLSTNFPLS